MTLTRNQRIFLSITALLFSTLACRAATRLIIPDTPTPLPPTPIPPSATPFIPPTLTPTVAFEASCPAVVADILERSLSFESGSNENTEEEIYLVTYFVDGDDLRGPFNESVPEDLKDEQNDYAAQEAIWQLFTRLIPLEQREFISGFSIITDGGGEILAAVAQSNYIADKWVLEVDILDSGDEYVLTFTLLHEFGHLLTLNASQVPPSESIFDNPDDDDIYQRELAACPHYFPGEGCSLPDSYINEFFDRFWFDLYAEWQEIDSEEDEDTYYDLLDDFYYTYRDQFLTDYAPTSPAEDIAESFAFFILSPKPELTSIADEKILFFHDYPELVALRRQILEPLCAEFPQ